ncbi:MAG: aspartate 1-decarboxylase [bacterium]
MLRCFLRSKIHRAVVTHTELHYEGSLGVDERLMELADLGYGEQIDVYNISNGNRFTTYVIPAEYGSGHIRVLGAAAHKVEKGDLLIIASYGFLHDNERLSFKPKIIAVDGSNRPL